MVAAGPFREDLLYRLDVIRVVVPPLRARPDEIRERAAALLSDRPQRSWRQGGNRTRGAPCSTSSTGSASSFRAPGCEAQRMQTRASPSPGMLFSLHP